MNTALETVMDSLGLTSAVIGNYKLDGVIGRGGMGVVFRAQQQHLKRSVAMKIIPAVSDSDEKVLRFEEEIKNLSRLSHPNIVRAYDAGRSGGVTYLAMELIEGETLDVLVQRKGPLKPRQAVELVTQTARALAYSHQNGILHRDVKPANLILDSSGTVKLLDLGMLRMIRNSNTKPDSPTRHDFTETGVLLGTPEFMAPEQAADPAASDERSDIYALGGTFYFLLTGKRMFAAKNRLDAVLSHQSGDPPHVGSRLDEIFQRMVARDPAERYPTMDAVVHDLEAVRFPRWSRRVAMCLSAGVLLLVTALLVYQSSGGTPKVGANQTPAARETSEETPTAHPHTILQTALTGTTWRLNYPSTFVFKEGGIAHPIGKEEELWTWAAISSSEVVIRYPTGWINVVEFDNQLKTCRLHELGVPSKIGDPKQHRFTGKIVE